MDKETEQRKNVHNPEYRALIHKVKAVDPKAAKYMEKEAPFLPAFNNASGILMVCFVWIDTPQGHDYWSELSTKINTDNH